MARFFRRWPRHSVVARPAAPKRLTSSKARLLVQALEDRTVPTNFAVSNSLDAGAGSLRQAILDANANPGADTITFNAGVIGPILLTTGELAVTDDLTITGPGAAGTAPTLVIDGNAAGRVFNLSTPAAGGNMTLSGLIVQNGSLLLGSGAGILSDDEAVTLDRMAVRNNVITGGATDSGAGIAVNGGGSLTVRNSTISGNVTAAGRGAGIYFGYSGGSLLLENSTVSGNTASGTLGGGGIFFYGPVGADGFTLRNCTIQGNSTAGSGGGVLLFVVNGTFLVQNCTITGNVSSVVSATDGRGGGGISIRNISDSAFAVLTIQSSIISGNTSDASNGRSDLAVAALASGTNNVFATTNVNNSLIGVSTGFTPSATSGNNLPAGTDPLFDPAGLADNGGPTQTIALQAGSPALNVGSNPASLANGQRGTPRVQGAGADIGAFELTVNAPSASPSSVPNVTTTGVTTYTFQVTYADTTTNINVSMLTNSDVRVTGPGGFDQLATFVSSNPAANAPSVTATYQITVPGGFTPTQNGTYSVAVEPNQVFNTAGTPAAVPAATLGSFQVLVPQTFTVTSGGDSGAGTLRDALDKANAQPGTADTIVFAAGVTTVTLTSAELAVTDSVTITGPGAAALTVRRDPAAATAFRVFNVNGPGVNTITISDLTISGGSNTAASNSFTAAGDGGGVQLNGELLTLENVVISGNTSGTAGGGIGVGQGRGVLTVRNSTVSGNIVTGTGGGGGIYFANGGELLLESSTVSGNTAAQFDGGGIYFFGPGALMLPHSNNLVTVRNSTISGNSAFGNGGGIGLWYLSGNVLIQNSTITSNTAGGVNGGGGIAQVVSTSGVITVVSSIVSGNSSPSAPEMFSGGTVNVNFSAVGDPNGFTPSATSGNNLAGGAVLNLGALANNGGPTQTHALGTGSAAINAGSNPANLTSDQRGFTPRVVGAAADIGAFEVGATAAAPPTVGNLQVNGGGAQRSAVRSIVVTFSQVVNFAGGNGNAAAAFTLSRVGGGGNAGLVANVATVGTQTVVTLTFTNSNPAVIDPQSVLGTGVLSLADGVYRLAIADGVVTSAATGQALDGDANGTAGGAFLSPQDTAGSGTGFFFGLYRLFGDANGSGNVDLLDLAIFRGTFNQSGPNPPNTAFLDFLDADNSNQVDLLDLTQFRSRFNISLF